jgi:hypothetical protein
MSVIVLGGALLVALVILAGVLSSVQARTRRGAANNADGSFAAWPGDGGDAGCDSGSSADGGCGDGGGGGGDGGGGD